jgi:hypothetical protein
MHHSQLDVGRVARRDLACTGHCQISHHLPGAMAAGTAPIITPSALDCASAVAHLPAEHLDDHRKLHATNECPNQPRLYI